MASQSLMVWRLCPILGETIKRAAGLPQVRKFDASTSKTKLWSKWNVHENFDVLSQSAQIFCQFTTLLNVGG